MQREPPTVEGCFGPVAHPEYVDVTCDVCGAPGYVHEDDAAGGVRCDPCRGVWVDDDFACPQCEAGANFVSPARMAVRDGVLAVTLACAACEHEWTAARPSE